MNRSLLFTVGVLITAISGAFALAINVTIGWLVEVPAVESVGATDASMARAAITPRPRAMSADQYVDAILCRDLFDSSMIEQCASRSPSGTSPGVARTEMRVKLLVTIVASPEVFSSALIADEEAGGLPNAFSLGDMIHDREVVLIEYERVGLKRPDGTIEYLTMGDGEFKRTVESDDAAATTEEGGVSDLGNNKFVVDKTLFDKYISDISSISTMGRALLHRGPDGEFDGYRLSAIRRNTLADQLGIKNGDIIHSVNGESLNSVQAAMGAYNTMRSQSNFCFEISRRGSPTELCYEVR